MKARILFVSSSLRAKSHSRKLLRIAMNAAEEAGAECKWLDLGETPLPFFNPDDKERNDLQKQVRADVIWANGFVLGTADYHGSHNAPMKNFLDYFWHEFTGKMFGYICASHDKGLTTMDHLRTIVRQCYGWSLPYGIGFNGDAAFDANGALIDEAVAGRTKMLGHDIARYSPLIYAQFEADCETSPRLPGFAEKFKGVAP